MLQNECMLENIGFDTAENELSISFQNFQNSQNCRAHHNFQPRLLREDDPRAAAPAHGARHAAGAGGGRSGGGRGAAGGGG